MNKILTLARIPILLLLIGIASASGASYVQANGQTVAKINDTGIYYYHSDNLGSTSAMTDKDGEIVEEQVNLPFGEQISGSEKYGFTGKELDETELQYYGARHYNPSLGRFLNIDPDRDGMNWYSYVSNNPLRYVDPDGRRKTEGELLNNLFFTFMPLEKGHVSIDINPEFNEGMGMDTLYDMQSTISKFLKNDFFKTTVIDLYNPEKSKDNPPIVIVPTNNKELMGDNWATVRYIVINGKIIDFRILLNSKIFNKGIWLSQGVFIKKHYVEGNTAVKLHMIHEFTHVLDLVIKGKFKELVAYWSLSEKEKDRFKKENKKGYEIVTQQINELEDNAFNAEISAARSLIKDDPELLDKYIELANKAKGSKIYRLK